MATTPASTKSLNPWENETRRYEQANIEKALSGALEAEKLAQRREDQERADKAAQDKAREAAKAQERTEGPEKTSAPFTSRRDINIAAVMEQHNARQATSAQERNEQKLHDRGEDMAEKIAQARSFLAEKHASQDAREKAGTLETNPKAFMPQRIKDSEHASLLEEKGLSYNDRRKLVEAINLDLDAKAVEQKLGRTAETFLDEKHPQYAGPAKAKEEAPKPEPVQVAKSAPAPAPAAKQPKQPAPTPAPAPAKEAKEPLAATAQEKEPAVAYKPAEPASIPQVEVGTDGITRVYNVDELKKQGPMASEAIRDDAGNVTFRYAGTREQVMQAEANQKAPPGFGFESYKLPAQWHEAQPDKGWAPVEDRMVQSSGAVATPVHTSSVKSFDLDSPASAMDAPPSTQAAASPVRTASVEARDLGTLANPKETGVTSPVHTAEVRGQDLGTLDKPTAAAAPVQVAAANQRIVAYDLPPLGADAPREQSVEGRLDATAQAYKAPDSKAVDNKLMQAAHPSEAERSVNVLGKEAPTSEAQPRFSEDTYARAHAFVKEQQEQKAAERQEAQEQTKGDQRAAKQAEREMEMEA